MELLFGHCQASSLLLHMKTYTCLIHLLVQKKLKCFESGQTNSFDNDQKRDFTLQIGIFQYGHELDVAKFF